MVKCARPSGAHNFLPQGILYEVMFFKKSQYYPLRALIRAGVQVVGREVFVTRDCRIERGAKLHSPCHISGATVVGEGSTLLPGCVAEGASIGAHCTLGPFCNIRAGSKVGEGCRIGDFVELKNCTLGGGCKVAHLAYIGDATLGNRVNVGCGVVFANYDGKKKERTYVGDNAFVGCNSNIIAPADIGDGAYIAAGATLGGEVPQNSLAISRPPLYIKPNGAQGRYLNK